MHGTEKMRKKELQDSAGDCVFLVCREINTMEMNVSETHCLAAMGGVGDSSCMPVCVYIVCVCVCTNYVHALNSSLIVSLTCAHLCEGRRRAQKESGERQRFGRSLRGSWKLWSSFCHMCVCLCMCVSETEREGLPWQYIRCLAGAVWPATPPHIS